MKYILFVLIVIVFSPLFVFAADVNLTEDITLILPSDSSTYTLVSGAKFDSLTVNNANFQFVMSADGFAVLKSPDRKILKTSDINKSTVCNTNDSSITIQLDPGDSGGKTITITPSSDTCSSIGAGTIGSSGGGGGGSVVSSIISPQIKTPEPMPVVATPTLPLVSSPAALIFKSDLVLGMKGNDVIQLQTLLASDRSIYPEGLITGYYGPATKRAVERFQIKYAIVSGGTPGTTGFGKMGPKTRAKLQEIFGNIASKVSEAPVQTSSSQGATSALSALFVKNLSKGMTHADVKRLQQLLNSDTETRIASSGTGSPGQETEFFGTLTENAVKKFQKKYGIAQEGDPGYGYIGPKTRAKLQEVFSKVHE